MTITSIDATSGQPEGVYYYAELVIAAIEWRCTHPSEAAYAAKQFREELQASPMCEVFRVPRHIMCALQAATPMSLEEQKLERLSLPRKADLDPNEVLNVRPGMYIARAWHSKWLRACIMVIGDDPVTVGTKSALLFNKLHALVTKGKEVT